ncbi:unnamed protein product [Rhizoctonia solani]|uniref:Uncharacterized protein n=1 Tax=Rhizoctonia solani TaxID=456999 RepID=A0A8H3E5P8_9AGAM|nr:unnamed protein product [Rhizoctonia solani]
MAAKFPNFYAIAFKSRLPSFVPRPCLILTALVQRQRYHIVVRAPINTDLSKTCSLSSGIVTFRAGGHANATIQYIPRLAFGYARIDQNNLVNAAP